MTLTPHIIAASLMLVSAVLHATIGILLKRAQNKYIFRAIIGIVCAAIALPVALLQPVPPLAVWGILALSVSVHFIYQVTQAAAFTRGDMSVVYPVMRGVAPALAAIFAIFILHEGVTILEGVGLIVVVASLIGFGWPAGKQVKGWRTTLGLALICGAMTALYTVIDAYGVRAVPIRMSYVAWFFVLDGLGIFLLMAVLHRKAFKTAFSKDFKVGIIAGGLSLVTYGSALYALSLSNVAPLAALRETSIVFGAIFAAVFLCESFGARRIALALCLAFGLILMQTASL